jgi:protein-S-isoprenylcysteine O-methyltransferase Ste14
MENPEAQSSHGAALKTIAFALLVPGVVIGYIPWRLAGFRLGRPLFFSARVIGIAALLVGVAVIAEAMVRFVRQGHGTPAPIDAPKRLVVAGLYRYVRNPMYLGVLGAIVGQGLLFASDRVLAYAALVAGVFHLFVVFYEEPHLASLFGADYDTYRREVRRWLPRLRPVPPRA